MKRYSIIFSVIFLMSMTGMGAAAPSPQNNDPVSAYMMVEDLPSNKPVTHLLSFGTNVMMGCEDGLFVQGEDKAWKRALPFPHSVMTLIESGGYAYVLINKSQSKFRADLWWYRSNDGKIWEQCHKPSLHEVVAFDGKRNITYRASKDIAYKSALYSSVEESQWQLHGDKRLQKINSLAVQSSSGNLLVGTAAELYLSKDQGKSFTGLNAVLGIPAYKGGHTYHLLVNDAYILVQVDSYRLFLSKDSGAHFVELTAKGLLKHPKGKWGLRQICALSGSCIIVRKNSDYYVVDLANGDDTKIILPRYYHYQTMLLHDDMLYAATKTPFEEIFKNITGKSRTKVASLLKLSLSPLPSCRLLLGNQKPITIRGHLNNMVLMDNDSLYMHEKQFLWNLTSGKKVSDQRVVLRHLVKGSKGYWYSRLATIQDTVSGKFSSHTLLWSKDKGISWSDTGTRLGLRQNTIFDDSLEIAYSYIGRALLRKDWKSDQTTQHYFEKEDGLIVKLLVDANSRLWVLTTAGLFVSIPEGLECVPLPFKKNKEIPITNFVLMNDRMVINDDGRIYISPIDKVKWETHTICDPCDDDLEMRFRLIGNSNQLLVLQEKEFGHIWLLNPSTDEKQRVYFPRKNGLIRKAYIRANTQLLVETTGVPIVPNGDKNSSKLMKHAPLFSYNIHLKTTDHGSK